jgi:hypothetical protein
MATDIEVASNALVRIGVAPISSFTEGGASGQASSNLYEITVKAVLSEYNWVCTKAKRQLARLTEVPLNDYEYAFQLPSGMLKLNRVFDTHSYKIFEDKIYANSTELFIDYQFRASESGWPAYLQLLMEYKLASEFALIVTSNEEQNAIYEGKYERYLKKAKFLDAQQTPPDQIQHSPYRDVRS